MILEEAYHWFKYAWGDINKEKNDKRATCKKS